MNRGDVTVGVATCPQQWIGYWGYDDPAKLAQTLRQVLSHQEPDQPWDISSKNVDNGILVSLSASGIQCDPGVDTLAMDIWVWVGDNSLTLGRQSFGRVPLYWMQRDRTIWFATRLQGLLPLVTTPTLSLAALYGYSCFSYVPTPLTPIEQIHALPAGTEQTWRIDLRGNFCAPQSQVLFDWQEPSNLIREETDVIAQLQILLKQAVERQISDLTDEPVGILLSGGLDSSIVAALLVQAGVKVLAYTLDLGESSISEYPYAEQVAHWLKIPLIKVEATPRRIRSALLPTVQSLDLPFGDGVTVPLFLLYQAARQDTRIVFNGEGGDQLFAGWPNKPVIAASLYESEFPDRNLSFEQHYLRTFHRLWGYEAQVFQSATYHEIQQIDPQEWLQTALDASSTRSLLHRLRRASLMLKGAQNIQPRATNLAFAQGLWVRSPFCDQALAEWTFQLSGELFLQGACEKYILKRAVADWLPPEIVWREKRGMGVPLTPWCLQEGWRSLGNWLNPAILEAEGRWQPDIAARVAFGELGGLIQGRRIGEILWLMMMWQLWRSQVLGGSAEHLAWNHPFWLPYPLWRLRKQWF